MRDENSGDEPSNVGRRDVLKMSGAALGAATFFAAANAAGGAADAATVATHIPTKVVMLFAGRRVSTATQFSPQFVMPLSTTTDSTGATTVRRGAPGYASIDITRPWTGDLTFQSWFTSAQNGQDKPEVVSFRVLGRRGSTISQLTLNDARVLGYEPPSLDKAKSSAHATEKLSVLAESWSIA